MEEVFTSDDDFTDIEEVLHRQKRLEDRKKRRTARSVRSAKPAVTAESVAETGQQEEEDGSSSSDDPDYTPEPETAADLTIAQARRRGRFVNEMQGANTTSGEDWPVAETLPIATYLRYGYGPRVAPSTFHAYD